MIDVAHRGPYLLPETLSTTPFALATFRGSDDAPLRDGPGPGQAQTVGPEA